MGSLSSRPKVPSTPQIVYVQQPITTTTTPSSPTQNSGANASGSNNVPSTVLSEVRAGNLLRRDRGRTGTIQTSYRGLLEANTTSQKKTLLGE